MSKRDTKGKEKQSSTEEDVGVSDSEAVGVPKVDGVGVSEVEAVGAVRVSETDVVGVRDTDAVGVGGVGGVVGVALSGGGIRSAAFCCGGLLQLATDGFDISTNPKNPKVITLDNVTHLSCVSGGGYTGTALYHELAKNGRASSPKNRAEVMAVLAKRMPENSNYLVRCGTLSGVWDFLILFGVLTLLLALFGANFLLPAVPIALIFSRIFRPMLKGCADADDGGCHGQAEHHTLNIVSMCLLCGGMLLYILAFILTKASAHFNGAYKKKSKEMEVVFEEDSSTGSSSASEHESSEKRWCHHSSLFFFFLARLCNIVAYGALFVDFVIFMVLTNHQVSLVGAGSTDDMLYFAATGGAAVLKLGNFMRQFMHSQLQGVLKYMFFGMWVAKIAEWRIYREPIFWVDYSEARWDKLLLASGIAILAAFFLYFLQHKLLHWYYRWRLAKAFYGVSWKESLMSYFGPFLNETKVDKLELRATVVANGWQTNVKDQQPYKLASFSSSHLRFYHPGRVTKVDLPSRTSLADVMAISGSAVAYEMGSYTEKYSQNNYQFLQLATGIGLGNWKRTFKKLDCTWGAFLVLSLILYMLPPVACGALLIANWTYDIIDDEPLWLLIPYGCGIAVYLLYLVTVIFLKFVKKFWPSFYIRAASTILGVKNISSGNTPPDYLYMSDGGHMENLGLVPLLYDRCKVILVFDGGASDDLNSLHHALNTARKDLFCEFSPLETEAEQTDIETMICRVEDEIQIETAHKVNHLPLRIRVRYPGGQEGTIVYFKLHRGLLMSKAEREDYGCCCCCTCCCKMFLHEHPWHSTANQFFALPMFEKYCTMGKRAVKAEHFHPGMVPEA